MNASRQVRARRKACRFKVKLGIDDAQGYLLLAQKDTNRYKDPENLELYMCPCGWLHIGHKLGSKKAVGG